MYINQSDENYGNFTHEEKVQKATSNIFLNDKIHLYVFEVPENYEMKIDIRFLESKVISALQPEKF